MSYSCEACGRFVESGNCDCYSVPSLTHYIIKKSADTISDIENELAELKKKYDHLLRFAKRVVSKSCGKFWADCNVNTCDKCYAELLLVKIGEL